MKLSVAAWNVEKNGQASELDKQTKVSDFIDVCCKKLNVGVLFLCEVHSARIKNYEEFLKSVYGPTYAVYSLPGGYSNAYVILVHNGLRHVISRDKLQELNRSAVLVEIDGFFLGLAHFKSGQTMLTKDQVENFSNALQGMSAGKWALTGDMNWDYKKANQLVNMPAGSRAATCWADQSQAKGGILDWCVAGSATAVEAANMATIFAPQMFDMQGPDHKPVLFGFTV